MKKNDYIQLISKTSISDLVISSTLFNFTSDGVEAKDKVLFNVDNILWSLNFWKLAVRPSPFSWLSIYDISPPSIQNDFLQALQEATYLSDLTDDIQLKVSFH